MWLSRGRVLSRMFKLREEIQQFLHGLEQEQAGYLDDSEFAQILAYLVDLFTALNELNRSLKGRGMDILIAREKLASLHLETKLFSGLGILRVKVISNKTRDPDLFIERLGFNSFKNRLEVNEDNVLFRNVFSEFESNTEFNQNSFLINKLIAKYPHDIDATILYKALRNNWKTYLLERPSLELCKSLVMLRDFNISGRLNMTEIPAIFHLLQFWKSAFLKFILWEAGVTVSNKVLECLILRFVKNKIISSESYMTVMVRLHLAHERYHSIDTKMKGNPLSLEEVILMTIYS
ncbi:unnamed protein product [Lepeophtheirus salmonis]|uniref:(salmon louse) hypothetical protein n=1 Tax=Lepeophtheirus salmonis TaxID=72036 RepID=A0A7R8H1S0_LEPSM|nr:unnamed protein product [Lepeophtheirus salmonis]CAF2816841.1 unnamed protein product [Lepeophtheirus salmonis]